MNGKIKGVVIAGLVLVAVASFIYVVPAMAYMNGTSDQTHDRDRDRLRDGTCNDCTQDQNQTCTQSRLHECAGDQISASGVSEGQRYQHQYRFRNQKASP